MGEDSHELTLIALLREANDLVTRLEAIVRRSESAAPDVPASPVPQQGPVAAPTHPPHPPLPALARLTRCETRVLDLLLLGLSNRQIARSLVIAEPTVKNHLHAIFGKLGVTDRTQAVSVVLRG